MGEFCFVHTENLNECMFVTHLQRKEKEKRTLNRVSKQTVEIFYTHTSLVASEGIFFWPARQFQLLFYKNGKCIRTTK